LNAIQALYQLSYGPTGGLEGVAADLVERRIGGLPIGRKGDFSPLPNHGGMA
jgi:hypothetical protein